MVVSDDELDVYASETMSDGKIDRDYYCSHCAYCLFGLPFFGRCPECGQEYRIRRKNSYGIFQDLDMDFPAETLAFALLSTVTAIFAVSVAYALKNVGIYFFSLLFCWVALAFGRRAFKQFMRFRRALRIARLIDKNQETGDEY